MRLITFLCCMLTAGLVKGQDLTGIWRGSFNSSEKLYSALNISDRYKFEVQIDDNQTKKFTGVTYSYKTTVFYGKAVANGTINTKTGKVLLQEIKIVELKMQGGSDACIMTCFLQYSKNGDEEFLEGKYTSYNERDSSFCGKGTVILRKVDNSDFYKEPFLVRKEEEKARRKNTITAPKKINPPVIAKVPEQKTSKVPEKSTTITKAPNSTAKTTEPKRTEIGGREKSTPRTANVESMPVPPSVKRADPNVTPLPLATRANEVVKTLVFNTNEITINVYDNGTIDHDTISIYIDKKLVISKQMLTTSPITVKLKLDNSTPVHELVMVAENLGDIPPNTSLMVVKAADKQYEVRITSTEQKNAVIIFRYENP
jgi:hypothetical protein